MFWNKKPKCQHIWHYAGKGEIIINNYVDVEIIDACRIFCPHCSAEKNVYPNEWAIIQQKQSILEDHNKINDF